LEGFRLIEKMGDGAFSNVYKAIERKSGRKVAVKVVRKYELNSSQVRISSCLLSSPLCVYIPNVYIVLVSPPTPWPGWDLGDTGVYSFLIPSLLLVSRA
jgi:serine/threonine protein kinase